MNRRRWERQDFASISVAGGPRTIKRCKAALMLPQTIHSFSLLLFMSLLYILCGVDVVSALSVPLLPITRLSPTGIGPRGLGAIRSFVADSSVEQEADSGTVGLFSRDFPSDALNESDEKAQTTVEAFPHSEKQIKSIHSNAAAVLLKSGPGTGKTYALASRIAYLIQSGSCRPEQMVVLSFTNRDAHTLKQRAVNMYKRQTNVESTISTKEITDRLWSGTIHAFASSIIRTYSKTSRRHFRVVNSKEMRVRVDKCLSILLEDKHYGNRGGPSIAKLKLIRILHRDALTDLRQSRGILLHQMCRCMDLWKEAGVLPPPAVLPGLKKLPHNLGQKRVRDDCIELSMRLGISQNVAKLAIEMYPQYQVSPFCTSDVVGRLLFVAHCVVIPT